jgi:hypothetical protein
MTRYMGEYIRVLVFNPLINQLICLVVKAKGRFINTINAICTVSMTYHTLNSIKDL